MKNTANAIPPATLDASTVAAVAALLGLTDRDSNNAVEIKVEVVDVMEGVIGGEDVSIVPALLDLATGMLVLAENEPGHPLLVWDDCKATIYYGERQFDLPFLAHSVPDDLWRSAISDHIRANGYWAVLDLRALIA